MNKSGFADKGATSRPSIAYNLELALSQYNINPPPPIPVDWGVVIVSISCAVIAASNAVPPFFMICAAASDAYLFAVTTIPFEG